MVDSSGSLQHVDEATSHLDVPLERVVNAAVASLKITRIVVAHRPETIASARRVIALFGGVIAHDVALPPVPGNSVT